MITDFPHIHSAHCESGTLSGLLRFHGFNISEPMIFGIGAGLFFAYMPYIRYNSMPSLSFRIFPGHLQNNFNKRTNIRMTRKKFKDTRSAMDELDRLLDQNIPVGVITNLFYIPFFPEVNRFHYNNHNMIVYGKKDNIYQVSDPILENTAEISYDDLARARFSPGLRKLRGNMYFINEIPANIKLNHLIADGIKATCKNILTPMSLNGYRGIRHLSGRIKKWPKKLDEKMARRYMGNIIRMLEEVGTGGSGFRYMYAAFLQESAGILQNELLLSASEEMTLAGDTWREFSYHAAIICKTNQPPQDMFGAASDIMYLCSEIEEKVFRKLSKLSIY
jgi:hypothetical protein